MVRFKQIFLGILLIFAVSRIVAAQIDDEQVFKSYKWDKFDFTKKKVTKAQLDKLKYWVDEESVDELAIVRGILFGKRGRIFTERSIQDYLEKQPWYKPNKNFKNSVLTPMERANLDIIRMAEAERHDNVEPGDLRYWIKKEIPEDKVFSASAVDWQIMIAEIEAIHGKTFPEREWLQKYFDERYWYRRNPKYSPTVLSEIERKNLESLSSRKERFTNTAVSVGDMDKFQNVLLTEELLDGISLNDLRLMRFEFYARRGRRYTTPGFLQEFQWRDWYKPLKDQSKVKLNKIEEQNVKLIERMEADWREYMATEEISQDMLDGLFIEDLRVLRNEIYARHGRIFKDKELQKYFSEQPWYKPNADFKDEMLTEKEYKNLSIIRQSEESSLSKFTERQG
ncbi:MAG TPA: YARHG domain-containing protein [Pyrinomonadaceae bacterium]|nr:YARHG domain-containing protein [Pyrinomonadaceae bacterium]